MQLVPLPRKPTVVEILEDWKNEILTNPTDHSSFVSRTLSQTNSSHPLDRLKDPSLFAPTVIAGLQVYFDRALGANLLYRSERLQYSDIRKQYVTGPTVKVGQEKDMSSVYGAEHLVRLLGRPPTSRCELD
jgi:mortality factor 4-like protein 1